MSAIVATDLSKRYGETVALDGLTCRSSRARPTATSGRTGPARPPRSGSSLGLHRPSAGSAALFGVDAWHDPVEAHRRVAYVAGEPFLWPSMTGAETLELLARLRGGADRAYRDQLVERFELDTRRRSGPSRRATARRCS